MSASESNTDRWRRWTVALIVIVVWIDANALLYWWLEGSRSDNGRREPDAAVLAAYQEHEVKAGATVLHYRLLPPVKIVEGRLYPLVI